MFGEITRQVEKTKIVERYRELKSLFVTFKVISEGTLTSDNYFGARFEDVNEKAFKFYIFDSPVDVAFSMIAGKDGELYGKMTFTGPTDRGKPGNLLNLYFDIEGNLKETVTRKMDFHSMKKREDIEYVLWSLVTKLIELPLFETE